MYPLRPPELHLFKSLAELFQSTQSTQLHHWEVQHLPGTFPELSNSWFKNPENFQLQPTLISALDPQSAWVKPIVNIYTVRGVFRTFIYSFSYWQGHAKWNMMSDKNLSKFCLQNLKNVGFNKHVFTVACSVHHFFP